MELEKFGFSVVFLVIVGTLIWGIMMIHDDLLRIIIKQEKIIKLLEKEREGRLANYTNLKE